GGEDGRHQELERVLEVEGDAGPRIKLAEPRQDLAGALAPRLFRFPPRLAGSDADLRHSETYSEVKARTSQLTSATTRPPRIAAPQPLTCRWCGRSQAAR